MANVNLVLAAIVEDVLAQRVLADQARAEEREGGAGSGEVNQDVVRGAAGALGLAANVAQLLRLRVNVNEFDLVNDPVAAGQEAGVAVCGFVFHGGKAAVSTTSER